MTEASRPFPTNSSIILHKNCIINTNMLMKKVATKGPAKLFNINTCNLFIYQI